MRIPPFVLLLVTLIWTPVQAQLVRQGNTTITMSDTTPTAANIPQTLSATGIFSNLSTLTPNSGVVDYIQNITAWSDHAAVRRWFAIKSLSDKIGFTEDGNWLHPAGTVWVQHFDIDGQRGNGGTRRKLETRILVKTADDVYGLTYKWRSDQTNADLVPESGLTETLSGVSPSQSWRYPARSECRSCHNATAGFALGFNTRQMNRTHVFNGVQQNQISALSSAGYFSTPATNSNALPAHARMSDVTQSVESRLRSYLAVNCAQCHQPRGTGPTSLDTRPDVLTDSTGLINGILANTYGDPANRTLVPGDTHHSMLLRRMRNPVLFNGDFETGDKSQFTGQEACCGHSAQVVSSPVRSGNYAVRYEIRRSDPDVAGNKRAELGPDFKFGTRYAPGGKAGDERWFGFSIFIPSDWVNDTEENSEIAWQVHEIPDACETWRSPPLALRITEGEWILHKIWDSKHCTTVVNGVPQYEGAMSLELGPLNKGQWNDFVIHVKWSFKADGKIEVWRGNQLVLTDNGPNCFNDDTEGYTKMGLYKWGWKFNPVTSLVNTRVIYHDQLRVGDASASFADVSPTTQPSLPTVPRMPPVGSFEGDPAGISLITQWINSLPSRQTFTQWQIQQFGSSTAASASPGADPDADGQTNAWEFLAGTAPLVRNGNPLAFSTSGGNASFSFTQPAGRSATVEVSDDLLTWQAWNGLGNSPTYPAADITRTLAIPMSSPKQFFRQNLKGR